ncbi:hypothetical protein CO179_00065 [candidate division WWE3 bacterium CG_4_9_14_3_um_filter_39_7]|uniref:Sugar ABC transporter substrate-binding protein n=2 Tax=Katanobacteria TaxID=422282 RepID=A0A2M7X5Y1_UNCKA|nr:MAG: hypothetical protein CO179_00065 [candidate division WWE3 bacterium CG_4_9_14_3_um_filter_39_7]
MRRALIFIAIGLILLGATGWILYPNVRSDILERIPFFNSTPENVTLTYWGLWEPKEVMQPLIDKYQSENPHITIEYVVRDPATHYDVVNARIASEGAPDIVRLHSTWVPSMTPFLSSAPKSVISVDDFKQEFFPVNRQFLVKDNSVYGLPLMIDGIALVYNKDLFAAEGITAPPTTWNEFRDYAARLTRVNSNGEMLQSGAAMGYGESIDYSADLIALMMAQNGAVFQDEAGNVTFHNSLSAVGSNLGSEALQFYSLFAKSEKSWDPRLGNSTDAFASGKVAMAFLPSHRVLEILNSSPKFKIGVAMVPQLPSPTGEIRSQYWANFWSESVVKSSQHPEEAWKFLRWLSREEQLISLYKNESTVRAFGEPYPRTSMVSSLSSELYTGPYSGQGPSYTSWYIASGAFSSTLNNPIEKAIIEMLDNTARGLESGPEGELINAAAKIQQVLTSIKAQ